MSKLIQEAQKKRQPKKLADPVLEAARREMEDELAAVWKSGEREKIRATLKLMRDLDEDDD